MKLTIRTCKGVFSAEQKILSGLTVNRGAAYKQGIGLIQVDNQIVNMETPRNLFDFEVSIFTNENFRNRLNYTNLPGQAPLLLDYKNEISPHHGHPFIGDGIEVTTRPSYVEPVADTDQPAEEAGDAPMDQAGNEGGGEAAAAAAVVPAPVQPSESSTDGVRTISFSIIHVETDDTEDEEAEEDEEDSPYDEEDEALRNSWMT